MPVATNGLIGLNRELTVKISVGVDAKSPGSVLGSLYRWLRNYPGLGGCVTPSQAGPGEGELGGTVDVLVVAAGSGGALTVLAGALGSWARSWRSQRGGTAAEVELTLTPDGGRTVKVNIRGAADVEQAVLRVLDVSMGRRDNGTPS
jgi:hypothetical protein